MTDDIPHNGRPAEAPEFLLDQFEGLVLDHYRNDRLEAANRLLDELLKHRPERDDLWCLAGVIHRRRNRYADALKALRTALQLDAENYNAACNLGEILISLGQVPTGVDILESVFDETHRDGVPAEEQSEWTIRAGAQLELVRDLLDELEQQEFGLFASDDK